MVALAIIKGAEFLSNVEANKVQRDYDIFCQERARQMSFLEKAMEHEGLEKEGRKS